MDNGARLRKQLESPGLLVLPGVYDCISARIAEQVGFEALFTSGFGISAAALGRPDFGFLTATEMLSVVGNLTKSVQVPVVADIDTGYGNVLNVHRTVSDIVSIGAAGIILEDQQWPKRCGHFEGKSVIPCQEHVEKIQSAVEARGSNGLVIIGRTDARAVEGLERAIARGRAYSEAGADVIFVEAPQSQEELETIARELAPVPTFANMVEGGRTPLLSAEELEGFGFKIAVYPLTGLFAAAEAIREAFSFLRSHGSTKGLEQRLTFGDFEQIVDLPGVKTLERKLTKRSQE